MIAPDTRIPESLRSLQRYYRWHSVIYDVTRWSFLFGRSALFQQIRRAVRPDVVLEIGCGTGSNLVRAGSLFPPARLIGLDVSGEMLDCALKKTAAMQDRTVLRQEAYLAPTRMQPAPDLIVFSYCLTMIDPGWEQAIDAAREDLASGGLIAVVDFHTTPSGVFRRWMRRNHVRMEGEILPFLQRAFRPVRTEVWNAYFGFWSYFLFVGAEPGIRC